MSQKFGWTLGGALTYWLPGHSGFEANVVLNESILLGIRAIIEPAPGRRDRPLGLFIACDPLGERQVSAIGRRLRELRKERQPD